MLLNFNPSQVGRPAGFQNRKVITHGRVRLAQTRGLAPTNLISRLAVAFAARPIKAMEKNGAEKIFIAVLNIYS
jgi:hypothetical protein